METLNTLDFMIAGFSVIFGMIALYVGSLVYRFKKLKKDEAILKDEE